MSKAALIVYHSADPDGWFSNHIAREALTRLSGRYAPSEVVSVGWDYKDGPMPAELSSAPEAWSWSEVFILDISIADFFKKLVQPAYEAVREKVIWIDHHSSAIRKHADLADMRGVRHPDIAASRLTFAYFHLYRVMMAPLETVLDEFVTKPMPSEPMELFLTGLYDAWKYEGTDWEERALWVHAYFRECALDYFAHNRWSFRGNYLNNADDYLEILRLGKLLHESAERLMRSAARGAYVLEFEGRRFMACNTAVFSSRVIAQKDRTKRWRLDAPPGVEGILLWGVTTPRGESSELLVRVGLYSWPTVTPEGTDFTPIANHWGGGGHAGACGFTGTAQKLLPLLLARVPSKQAQSHA
jgi:hypothetical protein